MDSPTSDPGATKVRANVGVNVGFPTEVAAPGSADADSADLRCVGSALSFNMETGVNVNPGFINHDLLSTGVPPNSHNMILKW